MTYIVALILKSNLPNVTQLVTKLLFKRTYPKRTFEQSYPFTQASTVVKFKGARNWC